MSSRSMRLLFAGILLAGCGSENPKAPALEPPVTSRGAAPVTFADRSASIDFVHVSGARGSRYLIETMGSGAVWFDFDGDEDSDLYLVQSGPHPDEGEPMPNRLFRNDGGWKFTDVTVESGVGDRGYGMGAVAADIDNDQDLDLYVTNFGSNVLFRNRGDGTFEDISESAGVGDPGWGTSSAFLDYDGDGLVDLYVVNYLQFSYATHKGCFHRELPIYCSPGEYPGQADRLYRNLGGARFEDATKSAGLRVDAESKGLGVVATDLDDDGWPDLYVANDSTPNFLYRNRGNGTFEEVGQRAGVSRDANGRAESGMGVDAADYDGDGDIDLIVTNYQHETNTLYRNDGDWLFTDVTTSTRLTAATYYYLGFGVAWFDADSDGWPDLAFANGHVMDNVHMTDRSAHHAQKNNFLLGTALESRRVFEDWTGHAGAGFEVEGVGRGLATADVDRDGDVDLIVSNCNGPVELLENRWRSASEQVDERTEGWLSLRLFGDGKSSNRSAIGARVQLVARDESGDVRTWVREVRAGSSYLSQNDLELHFGLGNHRVVDRIEVRWPGSREEAIYPAVTPGARYRVQQGEASARRIEE